MKRIVYILLLISVSSIGQNLREFPESNISEISNQIIGEFITEAHQRDWYPDLHIDKHLKGVYFIPQHQFKRYTGTTNDGRAGNLVPFHNYLMDRLEIMLLIDSRYLDNYATVKAFVWHELGHFFGLDHDDTSECVMNSSINGSILTPENIEVFFRKLKNVPPADYRAIIDLSK